MPSSARQTHWGDASDSDAAITVENDFAGWSGPDLRWRVTRGQQVNALIVRTQQGMAVMTSSGVASGDDDIQVSEDGRAEGLTLDFRQCVAGEGQGAQPAAGQAL